MTYNEFTVVSPTSYSGKAGKSSPGLRSPVESAPDTKLTRERLGSLMNLITPEALGYSETPKKKGRKKSVAAGSRKPSVKPSSRTGSSKAKSSRTSISTNSSAGNKSRKTSVKR
ncbi:hypothetical protein AGDE_13164 [Angomonas deanei]|nr:hypothetical protein AGDE_13164 [Angomonas deanei]|eukprot:EPY22685.1 hypothetical protein AGDE_13164 [Angomonas deanei]